MEFEVKITKLIIDQRIVTKKSIWRRVYLKDPDETGKLIPAWLFDEKSTKLNRMIRS